MSRTYHVTTFGCQMNAYDSELMAGIMAAKGWSPAPDEQSADVLLYNTCVIRHGAEQRAQGTAQREPCRAADQFAPYAHLVLLRFVRLALPFPALRSMVRTSAPTVPVGCR